jgi:hypothetical protein
MDAQNNDYLIYDMPASELLEAYQKREALRQYRDPDGKALLDEWYSNGQDIGYIRGLVRRLRVIQQSGQEALEQDLPPTYAEKIKRLKTDKRHIELFRDFAPGKAKLFEAQRWYACHRVGGLMMPMAIG